jgi:pimeloyl-ACP methyl ester carboxylesterase
VVTAHEVPPLLYVPGLGLDERAWHPTICALRGRLQDVPDLVALLPGFGLRPQRGDDLRPASLGALLVRQRLADLPAPTVLVGHSASCQVVAHAAALAPSRVSTLVLVGPTTDRRAATWTRISRRWLRTAVHEAPGQVPILVQTYTRTGLLWMLRTMDAARRDDVRGSLQRVTCPVLVVRGRHDRICPEDWARELVPTVSAYADAVTLDKGAHMVPLTHGGLLAETIAAALG